MASFVKASSGSIYLGDEIKSEIPLSREINHYL